MSLESPRLYRRHQRHARFARLRYSGQAIKFLVTEATRLESAGYEETLFDALLTNTADQIRAAEDTGDLH